MGLFRGVFFILGGAIGAGFISGAELVRFFHTKYFLLSLFSSSALFGLLVWRFLVLGKKYGGFAGTMQALFGRAEKWMRAALSLCSFVPCAGMLAGLDALAPRFSPLLSLAGLLLCAAVAVRGTKGISYLNTLLVPALLCFVFGARGGAPALPLAARGGGFGGIVYAGMNVLLLAPVLMDAGEEMKYPLFSALLSAAAMGLAAFVILRRIFAEGTNAFTAEMPFLYAMRTSKLFPFAVALAILTSLASSLYPLFTLADALFGGKIAAKGVVLFAAFLLSRMGLAGIVRILYPLEGFLGLMFSAVCILYDRLFEQRHKEIHPRREQAQNAGGAHHEVELEDLPAIDDEIPEPRPRDDVFAHDRSDPRHADGDLQHGDEGSERGGDHELAQDLPLRRPHRAQEQDLILICRDEGG